MLSWVMHGVSRDVEFLFNNLSHAFINGDIEGCEDDSVVTTGNDVLDDFGVRAIIDLVLTSVNWTALWNDMTSYPENRYDADDLPSALSWEITEADVVHDEAP